MAEELCGSLPRRHRRRRRRSARRRSRSASTTDSVFDVIDHSSTVQVDDRLLAKEVAELRSGLDASGSESKVGGNILKKVPVGCGKSCGLAANIAPKVEKPEARNPLLVGKVLENGLERGRAVAGNGTSGTGHGFVPTGCDLSAGNGSEPVKPGRGKLFMKVINKTENRDGETCEILSKTDEFCKNYSIETKLKEALPRKLSVMEKCVLPVNGMSFRNALEGQKHALPHRNSADFADFEKDEKKPPVMDRTYSRKSSLLNEDSGSRKNSVSKIDADWRQNLPSKDKSFPRNDPVSRDRHPPRNFLQSKDRYFVRRNSLPREDSSSRRNSFSREEPFVRKNSFGKSEYVSRRNSVSKEEDSIRRNSLSRDGPFFRKSSLSSNEPISQKNSVLHEGLNVRKNSEPPFVRKNSSSDSGLFSRKNSFSKDDFSKVDSENGRNYAAYENRSNENDVLSRVPAKKGSLSEYIATARKNSWSKDEFHELGRKSLIFENRTKYDKSKERRLPIENSQPFWKKPLLKDEFTPKNAIDAPGKWNVDVDWKCDGKEILTRKNLSSNSNSKRVGNFCESLDAELRTESVLNTDLKSDSRICELALAPDLEKIEKIECSLTCESSSNPVQSREGLFDALNSVASKNCNEIESSNLRSNSSVIKSESELNEAVIDKVSADFSHHNSLNDSESKKIGNFSATKISPGTSMSNPSITSRSIAVSESDVRLNNDLPRINKPVAVELLTSTSSHIGCSKSSTELCELIVDPSKLGSENHVTVSCIGDSEIVEASNILNQESSLENILEKLEGFSKSEGNNGNSTLNCDAQLNSASDALVILNGFDKFCKESEIDLLEINRAQRVSDSSVSIGGCADVAPSDVLRSSTVAEVCENICREFSAQKDSVVDIHDSTFDCPKGNLDDAARPEEPIVDNFACQWTPTNQVGKKRYSREFLYKLMELPQCNILPNLSKSIKDCIGKTQGGSSGFGGSSGLYKQLTGDQLYPFAKIGHSPNPRGSQHGGTYAFQPITKRSSQRNMKPNKIQLSLSLHEDVKLKETENAWKRLNVTKDKSDKTPEERETEELYNKVRSILNKLTPQKLDTLVSQIKELPINNPDRLAGVIDLIIKKAIDEPNFSEAYAKMCYILSTSSFINVKDKGNLDKNQTDFKRVLLNSCQKQFNIREQIEVEFKEKIAKDLKETTDPEKLKLLKAQHQEEERKIRLKAAGNCRFIGELFKLDMLRTSIMYHCISYLIKKTEEEPLESLCKLLTTIGKHYESRQEGKEQSLDSIMDELAKLASKNNKKKKNAPNISSRIRFMIQDVIELRQNRWIPRRDDNTPKTIDQIQKEADREQLETSIALSGSSLSKKFDRPRQDDRGDRKKMGGRMDGMSMNSDDWQTPKNTFKTPYKSTSYSIDTTKLENFRNMSIMEPLETIRLGMPKPNMWAGGAVTTKGPQLEQPKSKFSGRNQFDLLEDNNQLGLNNSASSKTSTLDRDRNRDNRNLSQDDDMLSKRGPMMGGPQTREGSVMRSAPPSIQPPVQSVKTPTKDDEGMKKSLKAVVDEYVDQKDIKELELVLDKDFVTPACLEKFIDFFFEYFMEKRKDQETAAQIFAKLLDSKYSNFTPKLVVDRFIDFISIAEDLIIDYPKFWDYVGMVLGYTVTSEHFNFDHVRQSLESILRTEPCEKVLSIIFHVLRKEKTPVWISSKWKSSNVNLKDFIAENNVDGFIKTNNLEYLSDPNAPVLKSSMPALSFEDIKSKLSQILRDNPDDALNPVKSWVEENWGSGPYDQFLIRPLMTAVCEASITGGQSKFDKETLKKHFKLIQYFVDYNPNLEAHCLHAVSMLMEKLQHPKGLALSFFQNLSEHIMSENGFKIFHSGEGLNPPENKEEERIKGIVLLGTRSFWTSLLESIDNSDDEGTS